MLLTARRQVRSRAHREESLIERRTSGPRGENGVASRDSGLCRGEYVSGVCCCGNPTPNITLITMAIRSIWYRISPPEDLTMKQHQQQRLLKLKLKKLELLRRGRAAFWWLTHLVLCIFIYLPKRREEGLFIKDFYSFTSEPTAQILLSHLLPQTLCASGPKMMGGGPIPDLPSIA
jgi:hypothetical protein